MKVGLKFFAGFFFIQAAFSQGDIVSIKTENEVSFLFQNKGELYEKNIIIQLDESQKNRRANIEILKGAEIIFDNKTVVVKNGKALTHYTITDMRGKNVINAVGISLRSGSFFYNKSLIGFSNKFSIFDIIMDRNVMTYQRLEKAEKCHSGGAGATECSTESANPLGGSCSVACSAGRYACCDDVKNECNCFVNGKGPDPESIHPKILPIKLQSSNMYSSVKFEGNDLDSYFVDVYNLTGSILVNKMRTNLEVDISNYPKGIYIYKIFNKNGLEVNSGKFIK